MMKPTENIKGRPAVAVGDRRRQAAFGDFQTPYALALDVCRLLARLLGQERPATVIEPTCGEGAFLHAAVDQFPSAARVEGWEINAEHVAAARRLIAGQTAKIATAVHVGDFFRCDWKAILAHVAEPILILGNPPWVTSATLGCLGSDNHPEKRNERGRSGIDAITGKSNFDVSEWMIGRLLEAAAGRKSTLAMLCKTAVARKVLARAWRDGLPIVSSAIRRIDAARFFGAHVDACLLICRLGPRTPRAECEVFDDLQTSVPASVFGLCDGRLVTDVRLYDRARPLMGGSARWRSGVKHDCADVFELRLDGADLRNAQREALNLEPRFVYPLLKSSQLAAGEVLGTSRRLLIPQQKVGDDTAGLATKAPATWRYLTRNAARLDRRASSVYRNQPPFSVFGVGPYTFAPWKVAVSGFYESRRFAAVGPIERRPVVFDDTCYFLPCTGAASARRLTRLLNSDEARLFFDAFVFKGGKRPLTAEILGLLDVAHLARVVFARRRTPSGATSAPRREVAGNRPG